MIEGTPTAPVVPGRSPEPHAPCEEGAKVVDGTRVAVVGLSTRQVCGVRDHAMLLADALARDGMPCSLHWLTRPERSASESRARIHTWTGELAAELSDTRPRAILLHYSAFAYAHRGLPLFVHPVLATLRQSRVPVIAFMHELVYPWRRGGLKGGAWALTQRAALVELMRACVAVAVTTDHNAEWLRSRRWLPLRPTAVAPVFSNLPRSDAVLSAGGSARSAASAERAEPVLGLFGYSLDPATIALVADALAIVAERSVRPRLSLLGAPGRPSEVADAWQLAVERRGVADALSIVGVLPPQRLADALASCDILLYADMMGPASRKGTLAASLASGRPLIAMEGRHRWAQFLQADAARVVPRTAPALAGAIEELSRDERAREALGARGRAFAERTMSVSHTAAVVRELLGRVIALDAQYRSPRPAPRPAAQVERAAR